MRPHTFVGVDDGLATSVGRVLRTLELVQAEPGIGAGTIAERLDVSDRAVRRYIAVLRDLGVPIDSTRGRYGGYSIGRSITPVPVMFTADEAVGVVMAVLDGHHSTVDQTDPIGSAIAKLMASLPVSTARDAEAVRAHATAAPDRAAARPDRTIVRQLVEAIDRRHAIRMGYTTGAGTSFETRFDPWSIVVRHGRWYLLGRTRDRNVVRAYRIDRIADVTVLNVDADVPDDLDPIAELEANLASGWEHEVVVEIEAPIDEVAPWVRSSMGHLASIDDGRRCRITGTTSNPDMYAGEWLASMPHPYRVVAGPELREAVARVAQRALAATGDAGAPSG